VKRLALSALLLAAGACGGEPVNLGPDPDFLWWSDHETGDLADWSRGGTDLGATYAQGGEVAVTADQARSGTHALRSTVTAPAANGQSAAQIWRSGLDAPAAYYGAWFLLPATAQPTSFWVFFSLRARTAPNGDVPLWDVKLAGAQPELQLLQHDTGDVAPLAHVPVPVGRWFHVEAFYVPAADASGRLQLWLDGTPIYDLSGPTAPADAATAPVTWTLGTITDGLTPAPATLFVDDAYVSRRRLGPGFPPFWRAR
jgi:hypothetical protein